MSKTPSARLRLPLMDTGDDPNAWGVVLNGLFQRLDESQGAVTVPVNANVTLTNDNYVVNQARYAAIRTTGTGLAGNAPALVTIPPADKWRIVKNDCAGDIAVGTGSGAAATVRAGTMVVVLCDGTDTFVIDPSLDQVRKPAADLDMNGMRARNGADGVDPTDFVTLRQTGPAQVALAKAWATQPTGEVVTGQGYSAFYYAQMAAAFANAGKASTVQAQAGSDDTTYMTPLKTAQAISKLSPPGPTLDDFRTALIQLAKLKGSTVGMAAGVADDFKDQSGVDAANSVNASIDTSTNTIINAVIAPEELAAMTSNSAPSGQSASATSELSGSFQAFQAYDGAASTEWISSGQGSQSIQRTTPAARREGSYAISPRNGFATQGPGSFTRWGSNDGGTTRVTLDTQTGITWGSGRRVFTIPVGSRGSYSTYGLTITSAAGATDAYAISALESLPETPGAMDLRSAAFAAAAVPAKGSLFVLAKATAGTIAANTNLLADISRDGGTTWTAGTLVAAGSYGGFTMYEANGFDISGQPSGTSMKWRLRTVGTALGVAVDAVVAQWG